MKYLLYSAIFGLEGKYDIIENKNNEWDLKIFTDNSKVIKANRCWTIHEVEKPHKSNRVCNRYYKWKIHELFPEYEYILYVDSKWILKPNVLEYIQNFIDDPNHTAFFFEHFQRQCLYKELGFVLKKGKDTSINVSSLKTFYESEGFPRTYGLTENSIFIRKLSSKWNKCCDDVYDYLQSGRTQRDQLCFMYFIWKYNLKQEMKMLSHDTKETNIIKKKFEKIYI